MTLKGLPLAASLLCLIACSSVAADRSAAEYIALLYAMPVPGQDARYSPRQDELWYMCLERAQGDYDRCPGFNMFVMTKEAKLTNLNIESLSDDGKTAEVKASFNNGERDVEVVFKLVDAPDEGWLIEEITSECVTLTDALNWSPKC
jgi:hypothetical protein